MFWFPLVFMVFIPPPVLCVPCLKKILTLLTWFFTRYWVLTNILFLMLVCTKYNSLLSHEPRSPHRFLCPGHKHTELSKILGPFHNLEIALTGGGSHSTSFLWL